VFGNKTLKFAGGAGSKITTHSASEAMLSFIGSGDVVGDSGCGLLDPFQSFHRVGAKLLSFTGYFLLI
jgi:hypothetical protein